MKERSVLLIVALLLVTMAGTAFAETNYKVQTGDNLYKIGQKVGIHHKYIMAANELGSPIIHPGQVLTIPKQEGSYHAVQEGENLFRISKRYHIDVSELIEANKLDNTVIFPGQKLIIPVEGKGSAKPVTAQKIRAYVTENDLDLLARLINAEARGEDYRGQLAVGAVILNRLVSDQFPDSIREIIFQRTKSGYQFTPVGDGSIKLPPSPSALRAAKEALQGEDPSNGALFFYNPDTSTDLWIKTLPVTKVIGNHVFAR